MKIVVPGGTGQVGKLVAQHWGDSHEIVVLSRGARSVPGARSVHWDAHTLGEWACEFEGADLVLNLAGRTVNCRYTKENLQQIYDSRIDSTRIVGEAIARAERPPPLWLQMSTATIYAHTRSQDQDEAAGVIGGKEPDVPRYWDSSIKVAQDWEAEQQRALTPHTRKVALRTAMVMTPEMGGVYWTLKGLARTGLGGSIAGGSQYMSWIYGQDFLRALQWIIDHEELSSAVNLCAPQPLPQAEFMKVLRQSLGVRLGLPATSWMAKIGAVFMRTDPELVLKSRRVVPKRLLDSGFQFECSDWSSAAHALAQQSVSTA